jgi:GMP synthase-like glutamine amidotransferase
MASKRPYSCLVLGGGYDYIRLMYDLDFTGAKTPEEADLILFTGGEDVDPSFYGENKLKVTYSNPERDRKEQVVYNYALDQGIPMVGICRGGQFLNIMNGGRMWQNVNNHAIGTNHLIEEVLPKGVKRKARVVKATSTHHQMMIPGRGATVLAVGVDAAGMPLATERMSFGKEFVGRDPKAHPDYEVILYPKTNCLCFQPHPEFSTATKDLVEYFDELVENHIIPFCP